MKIMTFNVRLWTRDVKRKHSNYDNWKIRMKAMHNMLLDESPDVICFQELIFPATLYVPNIYKKVGFSFHHQIYVKKGLRTKNSHWSRFCQYVDFTAFPDFRLFCVHGSWIKETQNKMMKYIKKHNTTKKTVICGDFNMKYSEMKETYILPPSAREMLNEPELPTFRDEDKEIDLFLMDGISPSSYCIITNDYGCNRISDHFPVVIVTYLIG